MAEPRDHRLQRYIRYAIAAAAIILVILVALAINEYRTLQREHNFQIRGLWYSMLLNRHAPLPTSDAGIIRPWMTFDYINRVFALPPSYLQAQLGIADPRYPRLTISAYASVTKADWTALVATAENAIREYPSPQHTTSTATGTRGT